ncbi:hypothetical protein Pcinc_013926 [Petrolisthes cinctipes]|uniref:VWFD domain-containing protein n=1 Tax=Petrolisthes cinctipes TaxID=88211 RepID=A0AAE1FW13_PETCI|nr:hypothetical protein Pcinc_013926 [Petrolisthes cinctipes]
MKPSTLRLRLDEWKGRCCRTSVWEGCEFDGVMYPNGGRLAAHCVTLECSRGQWVVKEYDDCCVHCSVYNDPHFTTFDGHYYDFHGSCNYSLAQTDTSLSPHTAVYSQFKPCFGHASCLDTATFRENPHVIVTLEPGVVDSMRVNEELYIVPASGIHVVTTSSGPHPLLAWRDHGCLQILGVSKIMVTHCSNILEIWAFPTHADSLDGLCGHFNYYVDDDLTSRDGQVTTLTQWPFAFPESWKTPVQPNYTCREKCTHCPAETRTTGNHKISPIRVLVPLEAVGSKTVIGAPVPTPETLPSVH